MAAAQATGTPEPTPARFDDTLWPYVEELLIGHLLTRGGGLTSHRSKGATESAIERAKKGSIRTTPCRKCAGKGFAQRGIVRDPCDACAGTGTVKANPKAITQQSRECDQCHGSGKWHPKAYRWPGIRPEDLTCCVPCRGLGYVVGADAGPGENVVDYTPTVEQTKRSWIAPVFDLLDTTDSRSALVLDMAYGSMGHETGRLGRNRQVALWVLTPAGTELVAAARKHHPRHWGPTRVLIEETHWQEFAPTIARASLMRRAEDGAIVLMARAKRALWAADQEAGARILKLAQRLRRKELEARALAAERRAELRKQRGYQSFNKGVEA